jgi:hypothetical protein
MPDRNARLIALAALALAGLVGCSEELPEFGQVTGTVTAKGKPLKGMIVTFMPDPTKGNELPYNGSGQTDAQGKYSLRYGFKGHEGEGAALGWNRVIVIDTRYSSIPQGAPLPPRLFSAGYSSETSTPLQFEIKPGPQTIDLDLK